MRVPLAPISPARSASERPPDGLHSGAGCRRARPGRTLELGKDQRETIPLTVYTNCDSAELFLKGRSLGDKPLSDRLQPELRWDVPGVLLAVGKRAGSEAARFELAPAGPGQRLDIHAETAAPRGDSADVTNF